MLHHFPHAICRFGTAIKALVERISDLPSTQASGQICLVEKCSRLCSYRAPKSQSKNDPWEAPNHEVDLTKPYRQRAVLSVTFSGREANSFSQDTLLFDLLSKISKWIDFGSFGQRCRSGKTSLHPGMCRTMHPARFHASIGPLFLPLCFRHFNLCKPLKPAPYSKTS